MLDQTQHEMRLVSVAQLEAFKPKLESIEFKQDCRGRSQTLESFASVFRLNITNQRILWAFLAIFCSYFD